jgi:REP element-mobilizing transposase RayT
MHKIYNNINMARKLRTKFKGATYHVMNRGDEGNAIFTDDKDKEYFIGLLEKGTTSYSVSLYSFCVMSNHYHLALKTNESNISEFMHYVGSGYGSHMAGNGWIGHVFAGRFKSLCVERDDYLMVLNRYISLNPVEAGLVADPKDYSWSSYIYYCRNDLHCPWIDQGWLLDYFGNSPGEARQGYRGFVGAPLDSSQLSREEMLRDAIQGDTDAAEIIAGLREAPRVDLDLIEKVVLEHYALEDMKRDGRGIHDSIERARRIFTFLSKEGTNATNKEISSRIGLAHPSGVTHKYRRALMTLSGDSGAGAQDKTELLQIKARIEELLD